MPNDALLIFSDQQAVTTSAPSQYAIDLYSKRDPGTGEPMNIVFSVAQSAQADKDALVRFRVEAADAPDFEEDRQVLDEKAVPVGWLKGGSGFIWRLQRADRPYRYLRIYYAVENGPLVAGSFDASLVKDVQDADIKYPSGFQIV